MFGDLRMAMYHAVRLSCRQGLTTLRCDEKHAHVSMQPALKPGFAFSSSLIVLQFSSPRCKCDATVEFSLGECWQRSGRSPGEIEKRTESFITEIVLVVETTFALYKDPSETFASKGGAHHSRLSLRHGRATDNDILSGRIRTQTHRAHSQPLCFRHIWNINIQ
jgi:hypothetical protein